MKPKSSISAGLAISALSVAFLCVGTSVWQAAGFMSELAENDIQRAGLYIATFAIIVSSTVLCRLIGVASRRDSPGWMIGAGIVCVVIVEVFSISTSMVAFSGHAFTKMDTENRSSAEYQIAMNAVNNLQNSINSAQESIDRMPSNWITKRTQAAGQVAMMNLQLQDAQQRLSGVQGSSVGKTFASVKSTTGLTPVHMALIGAILLSAIPATISLLSSNVQVSGVAQVKKQQPHLRAVA